MKEINNNISQDSKAILRLIELRNLYGLSVEDFEILAHMKSSKIKDKPSNIEVLEDIMFFLLKITKDDKKMIIEWLNKSSNEYFGLSPIEFMQLEFDNSITVYKNLKQSVEGEIMGS